MKEDVSSDIRRGSIVAPFIIGGLVGAGLALLFAPKSGKELRKDITDIAEASGDTIVSAIDKGKDLFEVNKTSVQKAVDAAKAAYIEEREKHSRAA